MHSGFSFCPLFCGISTAPFSYNIPERERGNGVVKVRIIRTAVMIVLGMLLILMLLPGKAEEKNAGITVAAPYGENGDVYVHICFANAVRQRDGRYLVEVEFTTDTAQDLTGMRMVTVFCGEHKKVFSLTKDNMEELHSVNLVTEDQPEAVNVEVRYHQTEAGLLLMSDGEGKLCGEAVAPVDGDRILQLSGGQPGASYQIYAVAELYELLSGMVILNLEPKAEELVTYAVRERLMTTLTADENGDAFCNFTQEGFKDGVYLVAGEGDAHYVCLPQVEASGEFKSAVARLSLGSEPEMQQSAQK